MSQSAAAVHPVVFSGARVARAPALPQKDMYGAVHRGLRWGLTRLLVRMGTHDIAAEKGTAPILDELRHLLVICESHLTHENEYIHTAVERRRAGAMSRLGRDHEEHEAAIAELRGFANEMERAEPAQRRAEWRRLYLRYSAFVGDNLVHMVDEEELSQAMLEQVYSAAELEQIQGALIRSIVPEEMLSFLRYMIPAQPPSERKIFVTMALAIGTTDQVATLVASLREVLVDSEWQELVSHLVVSVQ